MRNESIEMSTAGSNPMTSKFDENDEEIGVSAQMSNSEFTGEERYSELWLGVRVRDGLDENDPFFLDNSDIRMSVNSPAKQSIFAPEFIGLYGQYFATGYILGIIATAEQFCFYVFRGEDNVCSVISIAVEFPIILRVIFALFIDMYSPWGMGYKGWMFIGWGGVLVSLLVLAIGGTNLGIESWQGLLVLLSIFQAIANVPANGMSVQLGKLENQANRGKIMATCIMVQMFGSVGTTLTQTIFLNSQATSYPGCPIGPMDCWTWGLNTNGYYGLYMAVTFIALIPTLWLQVPSLAKHHESLTFIKFAKDCYLVAENAAFSCLALFLVGFGLLFWQNAAHSYLEFTILDFSNVQNGINGLTETVGLAIAMYLFKAYLMKKSWRVTFFCAILAYILVQFCWLPAYYNKAGLQNFWYVIFLDWDTTFVEGLTSIIVSLAAIEISVKGLEGTTYELITTLADGSAFAANIISVQMLTPFKADACSTLPVGSECVNLYDGVSGFNASDGPRRWSFYSIIIAFANFVAIAFFVRFLPSGVEECHQWKAWGEAMTSGHKRRVSLTVFMAVVLVAYSITSTAFLLNVNTACSKFVGGTGCH